MLRYIALLLALFLPLTSSQAAITFALRGDSLDARYSRAGKSPLVMHKQTDTAPAATASVATGVFGGSIIPLNAGTFTEDKWLLYPSRTNFSENSTFTIVYRILPGFTSGAIPRQQGLLTMGMPQVNQPGTTFKMEINPDSTITISLYDRATGDNLTADSGAFSFTDGVATDIIFTFNPAGSPKMKFAQDGVIISTHSPSGGTSFQSRWIKWTHFTIGMRQDDNSSLDQSRFGINELLFYNSEEDPTTFAGRTDFVTVAALDALSNSSPGDASVKTGVSYTVAGVTGTGSYDGSDRWTSPTAGQLLSGVALKSNSTSNNLTGTYVEVSTANAKIGTAFGALSALTGSYDGSDRWTCPAAGSLLFGASDLKCNSVSTNLAGTYVTTPTNVVKTGTAFGALSALTGTYTATDLYTDPGIANVLSGIQYKFTSAVNNRTGTLLLAQPYQGLTMDLIANPDLSGSASRTITKGDGPITLQLTMKQGGTAKSIAGATFAAALLAQDGTVISKSNSAFTIVESGASNRGRVNLLISTTDTGSMKAMKKAPIYVVVSFGGQDLTYYGYIDLVKARALE